LGFPIRVEMEVEEVEAAEVEAEVEASSQVAPSSEFGA